MEIEGLINHTLASALVERDYIYHKLLENKSHIDFWQSLREIHAHEELKHRLNGITHIRQILVSEEYMQVIIRNEPDEPLFFMDFPLKTIEFYLHLRELNRLNSSETEEERL